MADATAKGEVEIVELSRARKAAARRVAEVRATVPDFTAAVSLASAPAPGALLHAVAGALRAVPQVNGAYRDGHAERYARVNLGVTVPGADGQVTPTLFDADAKEPAELEAELEALAASAADGSLTAAEAAGVTFTIVGLRTSLARITPVMAPRQAATLGAGTAELTLVCDARVLEPADADAFLAELSSRVG